MSCAILTKALRDKRLTRTDLAILGILIDAGDTYPSRREIAAEAGCAASSVPRSARKLEELGYVTRIIDKRDHGKRAKPTRYVLKMDTYQDGHVSGLARTETEPLGVVVELPKRPPNPLPRSEPDTGQIPPKDNNQTPPEFYPEPPELVVMVAANSDRPPPPAWQRVLDAVRSPWLDENKHQRLILEGYEVEAWLRAGADEHRDVIPTVRRLIERKREAVPWSYFTNAVRQAAAKRKAAEQIEIITPEEASTYDQQRTGRSDNGASYGRAKRNHHTDLLLRDVLDDPASVVGGLDFSPNK